MQESTHKVRKSASKVVLGRMQLTLQAPHRTPHDASRLVHAMSAWSVTTRRSPSRRCRDARVWQEYGHATAAMHEISPPPQLPARYCRDARVYGLTTATIHHSEYPSPSPFSPPRHLPHSRCSDIPPRGSHDPPRGKASPVKNATFPWAWLLRRPPPTARHDLL